MALWLFGGWKRLRKIPQLCRILLFLFIFGSLGVWWFSLETYILLVPGLTTSHFYVWNVLTYSLVQVPPWKMGLLAVPLGFLYSMFESSWGAVPFLLFWSFVSVSTACSSIIVLFVLYTFLRDETLFYVPLSGCIAMIGGLFVAVKQLIPDHEIYILPRRFRLRMLANDLPFWFLLCSSLSWLVGILWIGQLVLCFFGVVNSWIYLRYLQKREYGRGDNSESFRLYTLLPVRVVEWLFSHKEHDTNAGYSRNLIQQDKDILPVTTTDPTEAERRRYVLYIDIY